MDCRAIIVIGGYLASGKSTFARRLSKALSIPYFVKDTFKIAICESVQITTREEGSLFSAVTFDAMMYVAERLMETGNSLIIEGNFAPPSLKKVNESGVIEALISKYSYRSLTYRFTGDRRVGQGLLCYLSALKLQQAPTKASNSKWDRSTRLSRNRTFPEKYHDRL